jgi:hypothetical protein
VKKGGGVGRKGVKKEASLDVNVTEEKSVPSRRADIFNGERMYRANSRQKKKKEKKKRKHQQHALVLISCILAPPLCIVCKRVGLPGEGTAALESSLPFPHIQGEEARAIFDPVLNRETAEHEITYFIKIK